MMRVFSPEAGPCRFTIHQKKLNSEFRIPASSVPFGMVFPAPVAALVAVCSGTIGFGLGYASRRPNSMCGERSADAFDDYLRRAEGRGELGSISLGCDQFVWASVGLGVGGRTRVC